MRGMLRVLVVGVWLAALSFSSAFGPQISAQEPLPLTVSEPVLAQRVNAFGIREWIATGTVTNEGSAAYLDVALDSDVTGADGEIVGIAYGVLVDVCGLGVLPGRALEPGETAPYLMTVELDADDLVPAALAVTVSAAATEAATVNPFLTYRDITTVYAGSVARVEWTRRGELRFAAGCADGVYADWDWYAVDVETGEAAPTDLPYPDLRAPDILDRLGLDDEEDVQHARIAFHPDGRRAVYQDPINVMLTAEPDGSFQRLIWDTLSSYSLQGYVWMPDERFLAYYFGAVGEPVRYFTASVAGQNISVPLTESIPSLTVPGPTPDGARVVISQTVDGVTGYYLASTTNPGNMTLLFEGAAPGNNYPAPVFNAATAPVYIYLVRDVDGQARLQCFNVGTKTLHTLTILPLKLAPDESAWSSLSPDGSLLAFGAEGRHGGLWLLDLAQYAACPR